MESTSLYDYNEDELLATIAASVYPNAKIRGVEWIVHYSGRQQLLPHADYLNLIQIIAKLITTITEVPATTGVSLAAKISNDDLITFEIERKVQQTLPIKEQILEIEQVFDRMKLEYVGQVPMFSYDGMTNNIERYSISFRLTGNELYPHLKRGRKIIIVETDRGLLSSMADSLSRDGFSVAVTEDPVRLFGMINSFNPEIILISLNLGEHNGLECCTEIRQHYPNRDMMILALLASPGSADAEILKQAGFSGFILKPRNTATMKDFVPELSERIRSHE